jgi:hypothetical protein
MLAASFLSRAMEVEVHATAEEPTHWGKLDFADVPPAPSLT